MNSQLVIALGEFWHVGSVLIIVIAGISILTGFVKEYIPQEKFQKKLNSQNTIMGAITGASLGILTPFCSASMVPVAMGMIEMSAPFSTVLPFLISAPLSNFVVVGIIFGAFGFKVALIYFLWTFGGAIVAGLTVGRSRARYQVKNLAEIATATKNTKSCGSPKNSAHATAFEKQENSCNIDALNLDIKLSDGSETCGGASTNGSHKEKIIGALQFAMSLFKQIVPYAIVGAAISGIALAYIPSSIVEKYVGGDSWYAIPIAATIGVPLYLRIEMAIPLLSTLLTKGMSMGAAMALLIGGTGASLPELAILSSMLKPKGVLVFTLTVLTLATSGGILFMFI
ncbi:MAG: permease [Gudongella sp.]|nr:permease [Gudongella sp.]